MPILPVHLGPGLLLKAGWRSMSLLAFGLSQVLLGLEPMYYMARKEWPLYRGMHTVYGAVAAGLLAALLVRRFGPPLLHWLDLHVRSRFEALPDGVTLARQEEVSWSSALAGGLSGGLLHLLIDAMIHEDIALLGGPGPSAVYGWASAAVIYPLCILAGVVGVALLFMQWWRLGGDR
ncbi:MAG: hypothetical protein HQL51_03010 [Magnetococcales bacterium]|nr:hypothetical protein [Magnetococcales bacterium]